MPEDPHRNGARIRGAVAVAGGGPTIGDASGGETATVIPAGADGGERQPTGDGRGRPARRAGAVPELAVAIPAPAQASAGDRDGAGVPVRVLVVGDVSPGANGSERTAGNGYDWPCLARVRADAQLPMPVGAPTVQLVLHGNRASVARPRGDLPPAVCHPGGGEAARVTPSGRHRAEAEPSRDELRRDPGTIGRPAVGRAAGHEAAGLAGADLERGELEPAADRERRVAPIIRRTVGGDTSIHGSGTDRREHHRLYRDGHRSNTAVDGGGDRRCPPGDARA